MYFSMRRRSNIAPETVEMTGCSGISLLTTKQNQSRNIIFCHVLITLSEVMAVRAYDTIYF